MRPKVAWLRWLVPILAVLLVVMYGTVSWYLAYQVTVAERKELEAAPEDFGLDYELVEFQSRLDDVTLTGWYMPVSNPQATIIISHGINGNRADTGIGLLEIARDMGERGFNTLLFDLRGHGESGGTQVSGWYFERYDVLGAFDFLLDRGVLPDKIGLQGYSMGGGIVLLAAAVEPRIRAVVADSPFSDVADLLVEEVKRRTDAPGWAVPVLVPGITLAADLFYGIDLGVLTPINVVEGLDYPVLLIHGTADDRIPAYHSQRMVEASGHPDTELWLLDGVEHVKSYRAVPEEYIDRVAAYFEERLR